MKATNPNKTYLTPPEVARRYGVSADKVRKWIEAGELRAFNGAENLSGTKPRYLVAPEWLEAFEAARAVVPPPPRQRRRRRRDENITRYV